ncbi:MAG: 50S ribosomal protein L6 [Desulfobacca sp.]|uniref:50S ribosomal protein L6 n=1 Tax=Desulfobacca sp. TaxID=2067990 RepID=UPI00404AC71E
MSRIGKKPIPLTKDVKVKYENRTLQVQGPKGTLSRTLHPAVELEISPTEIKVFPKNNESANWRYWGLERSLVANMVTGVTTGFTRTLEIVGTGYKVEDKGSHLVFSLGYSHPIEFKLPAGITAQVEKATRLVLHGFDKEALGQTAAIIRQMRPPEPYKGKGIKYAEEVIRRKVGKSGGR